MKRIFEQLAVKKPKKSSFDLSHERKLTLQMGKLVPILWEETMPGDTFKGKTEVMLRFMPMVAPVMHRINVFIHYFFVPNRIIWNEWEDFITGGKDGTTSPTLPFTTWGAHSDPTVTETSTLPDYMGLPTHTGAITGTVDISLLPFRAYQQIYNDYYRDPNLTDPIDYSTSNAAMQLRSRCWEKDYFTSAFTQPQRGADVQVPSTEHGLYATLTTGASPATGDLELKASTESDGSRRVQDSLLRDVNFTGTQLDVNDLRRSSAIQRWLETMQRGGHRYIEQIKSMFGVSSSDSRLQRAEYLGGVRNPVVISEVLNTSDTTNAPQGNMSGHGLSMGENGYFKHFSEEHGHILGILSVLPRTAYYQGISRKWYKHDKLDYPWPELANLGEQSLYNFEVYQDQAGAAADNLNTWGYQQRYAEYKHGLSSIHGDMKNTSFEAWQMARKFTSLPPLNNSFMESDPTDRIFASQGTDDYLVAQVYNEVHADRPLPFFAIPELA